MPVLSFYEGYSELAFVVFNNELDSNEHSFFSFPYTYSYNLFSNTVSKDKFYTDVFKVAADNLKINLNDYDIYATGVLSPPEIPFETKKSIALLDNIGLNTLVVNSYMLSTKNSYTSFYPLDIEGEDLNFRANLDLYHNIVYTDSRDVVIKDSLLRAMLNVADVDLNEDIILTGDRLREFDKNPGLGYLLMIDIIKEPGSFYIKMDTQNMYAHTLQLSFSNLDYPSIGTLVNIPGRVECLLETEVGTPQLIELEPDSLFVFPLDQGDSGRLLAKSSEYKLEKQVLGGELGLIIDTRDKMANIEFKEVYLNSINQYINKL